MKTVLLIDDDRSFRGVLSHWMADHGWEVIEAEDGETGVELVLQHRPELVLCDLMMPRCNGFQVCRFIRSQRALLPDTRVIVTTGSDYATDRLNALEAGADDYLVKPLEPKTLRRLLTRSQQPGSASPTVASIPQLNASQPGVVRFWGVRGSIPTPGPSTVFYGGNTACVEIRTHGQIFVLDAGTGIRALGRRLLEEFQRQSVRISLLITHTHWDHIQGFPFFVPAYNSENHVSIHGFDGARKGLLSTLSDQMESPFFPISMRQMQGKIAIQEIRDLDFELGGVRIEAVFLNHPGVCVGYKIHTHGGPVVYMPDNELYTPMRSRARGPESGGSFAQDQDRRFVEFARDAEVLIIDAQYDESEYPDHIGWGHSCMEDSVALAIEAGVKRLFLFHHDPDHDDDHVSRMVSRARRIIEERGSAVHVEAARETLEVPLHAAVPAQGAAS